MNKNFISQKAITLFKTYKMFAILFILDDVNKKAYIILHILYCLYFNNHKLMV